MSNSYPSLQELKTRAIREGARDPMRVVASVSLAILHGRQDANRIFAELKRNQPGLFAK